MSRKKKTIKRERLFPDRYCSLCGSKLKLLYRFTRFDNITGHPYYNLLGTCPKWNSLGEFFGYERHIKEELLDVVVKKDKEKNIPVEK